MNIVYKVVTKHTKQMLRDFVRFTYRMKSPYSTYRFCILGTGFWVLTPFFKGSLYPRILLSALGVLIIAYAFTRHLIVARKIARYDTYYQKQTEITFLFGHAEFVIQTEADDKEMHIQYGEITQVYKDKCNYYLWVNNEDVQILPRVDFTQGDEQAYETFIAQKTGSTVVPLSLPLGARLSRMNEARKQAEMLHDEKIKKKKEERKNERTNKR